MLCTMLDCCAKVAECSSRNILGGGLSAKAFSCEGLGCYRVRERTRPRDFIKALGMFQSEHCEQSSVSQAWISRSESISVFRLEHLESSHPMFVRSGFRSSGDLVYMEIHSTFN